MENLIGLLTLAAAAAPSADYESKVEIDGRTFRVHVEGQAVTVADKAFITRRSPQRGEQMRRAVQLVTGCEVRDSYWEGSKLRGILDCH